MQKTGTGPHCICVTHAHLIFVTKLRHKGFTHTHLTRMKESMRSVRADLECELVEFNGEDHHIYLR